MPFKPPSGKKLLLRTGRLLLFTYALVCLALYLFQEKFLFLPKKLAKDYRFSFTLPFEEMTTGPVPRAGGSFSRQPGRSDPVRIIGSTKGGAEENRYVDDVARPGTQRHDRQPSVPGRSGEKSPLTATPLRSRRHSGDSSPARLMRYHLPPFSTRAMPPLKLCA